MAIVLKEKCKRCIEWNLKPPLTLNYRIVSEIFLLQRENCNLEFYTGSGYLGGYTPSLSFKCSGKLQLPIDAALRVVKDSYACSFTNITITNVNQTIWSCTTDYQLTNHCMIFELIFHTNCLKDDKEVQTPSYIDINVQLGAVSKDFASLLNAGSNHDVEFLCGKESFKAHKDVICCRSTVFASMLGTDMQEGKTGQIKIHDMESSILNQFLLYLYTGVFPESTFDTILRMYQAADKYAVDSLKEQCASFLIDNLSHENACELLILSDKHNDLDLKKVVIEYVLKEKIPRRIGKKWIDFCKENQNLAIEVLNTHYLDFCEADHVSDKQ